MGAGQGCLQWIKISRSHYRRVWVFASTVLTAAISASAHSASYGTYEARGMAMGGAAIAAASPQQAHFYNPSLLALHNRTAEESLAGRVYLPVASVKLPAVAHDAFDALDSKLYNRVKASINAFNADPGAATAAVAQAESQELQDLVDELAGEPFAVEAFAGLAVAEPDLGSGGAFHIGVRVLAGARADITEADRAQLDNYIETFQFFIDEQTGAPPNPDLFEDGGQLSDPTDTVDSAVAIKAASIVEAGVSASHSFSVAGLDIAAGVTPKVMRLRVYEKSDWDLGSGDSGIHGRSHFTGNVDMGLATELGQGLRVGLAVKDVIEQSFRTQNDGEVRLRPKARAGLALQRSWFQLALDVDLLENSPLGFEQPVQDVAMGAELEVTHWLDLRLGYQHNLAASGGGSFAAGVGLHLQRFLLDLAYSEQRGGPGAALQLGYAF